MIQRDKLGVPLAVALDRQCFWQAVNGLKTLANEYIRQWHPREAALSNYTELKTVTVNMG